MKKRNPIAVALLPLITFGIYSIVWMVKTKGEMNRQGANIPTAWLLIIPFANIWWLWKYSEGVAQVTGNEMSTVIAFILLMILGSIGAAVVQYTFNSHDGSGSAQPTENTFTPESLDAPQTVAPTQPTIVAPTTTPETPAPPTSDTAPPTVPPSN